MSSSTSTTHAMKYLYAINVHSTGETFDLCLADIRQTARGESLSHACMVEGSGLVGTLPQVQDRLGEFEAAGVDLVLLQFDSQLEEMELEEMERFGESVISALVPA
jgi:hypothetical protein